MTAVSASRTTIRKPALTRSFWRRHAPNGRHPRTCAGLDPGPGPVGKRDRLTRKGAVRVFEDVVSGRTFDRPGPVALLDHARPGDTLAVTRLDRLGRSLRELLETVETLKAQEIDLISLKEDIDTTSAAGELVFHVFAAIAHFERRLISERTKDGLLAARKRGRTPGRPPLHADTVSALRELVDNGTSVTKAASYLGIGRSTAYRAIQETRP